MSFAGKKLRLSRIVQRDSGRGIIVPVDHGLTLGPIPGLETSARLGSWLSAPAVNAVIAHKGLAERLIARGDLRGQNLLIHVNGMHARAESPDTKEALTSVGAAQRLGADGISLQLNFDGKNDAHNMRLLGAVVDEAQNFGLPVLTMLYDKVVTPATDERIARLRHLIRLTVELGTDAVKLALPDDLRDVGRIVEHLRDDVLIFFAGGALSADAKLVDAAREIAVRGAAGLCLGRNIFQRQDPAPLLATLASTLAAPGAPVNGRAKTLAALPTGVRTHGIH